MHEYLVAAGVNLNMITPAGLAYIEALSNFLEFTPGTAFTQSTRRTLPELRAILNPYETELPMFGMEFIPIADDPNVLIVALRQVRQYLAETISTEFEFYEWVGISLLDFPMTRILFTTAAEAFTSTLNYVVNYRGQPAFRTNDYQLANGMLLAWTQYRESLVNSDPGNLPLTMSMNSHPLEPGTDIAIGLAEYRNPIPGELYMITLLHTVEISGDTEFDHVTVTDPRYLQGYASMIHWLSRIYPNPNTELPEILWDFVEYNNNGVWAPAELQHPPTLAAGSAA